MGIPNGNVGFRRPQAPKTCISKNWRPQIGLPITPSPHFRSSLLFFAICGPARGQIRGKRLKEYNKYLKSYLCWPFIQGSLWGAGLWLEPARRSRRREDRFTPKWQIQTPKDKYRQTRDKSRHPTDKSKHPTDNSRHPTESSRHQTSKKLKIISKNILFLGSSIGC